MNWLSMIMARIAERDAGVSRDWNALVRDRSGYVREAAVRALAATRQGAALPLLLERVNDWVPEVRAAARAAVCAFLSDEHLPAWGSALPQVQALRRAARADHTALLRDISSFLRTPERLAVLKAGEAGRVGEACRLLYDLEMEAAEDDTTRCRLLHAALASMDLVLALKAVRAMTGMAGPAPRHELVHAACRSRFAAVRAAGVRLLLRTTDPSWPTLARSLCFDRSGAVRGLVLTALGEEKPALVQEAARVWAEEGSPKDRAIALELLCALVPEEAHARCRMALADTAGAVRRIAYAGCLLAANGDERDRLVCVALADRSARVRDLAALHVRRGASPPPAPVLLTIVTADPMSLPHAIRLAEHLSFWEWLQFLLQAWIRLVEHPGAVGQLEEGLTRWQRQAPRCFLQPSIEDRQRIGLEWGRVRDALPAHLQRGLALHLRSFGLLAP